MSWMAIARALFVSVVMSSGVTACFAQQDPLANQSKEDLLKGFDVDPSYLNKFQSRKPALFSGQGNNDSRNGADLSQSGKLQAQPSSLLNQNKDDLLKGFDVDPSYVGQFQPQARASTVGMLMNLVGGGRIPGIDIDTTGGDGNIKIRAPFVNIDMHDGHPKVKINAPFVKVDTGDDVSWKKKSRHDPNDYRIQRK